MVNAMATRKAFTVFNNATSNAVMLERLTAIARDDRWRKCDVRINHEISSWAFQWAQYAFDNYGGRDQPSLHDAQTIFDIAGLVLKYAATVRRAGS